MFFFTPDSSGRASRNQPSKDLVGPSGHPTRCQAPFDVVVMRGTKTIANCTGGCADAHVPRSRNSSGRPIQASVEFAAGRAPYGVTTSDHWSAAWTLGPVHTTRIAPSHCLPPGVTLEGSCPSKPPRGGSSATLNEKRIWVQAMAVLRWTTFLRAPTVHRSHFFP